MPFGSDTESTDSAPHGIPVEFQLEDSYLRNTLRKSRNSGNFAVTLTRKLFTELFGEGKSQLVRERDGPRTEINHQAICLLLFSGIQTRGGVDGKNSDQNNKWLRRNDKGLKKDSVSTYIILPESDPQCLSDVFEFTN